MKVWSFRNSLTACGTLAFLLISCNVETPGPGSNPGNLSQPGDWAIPSNEVIDGGPGKDGIPSIDLPGSISKDDATYLKDDDLVIGLKVGNEYKAYPHLLLDWHEIVNDVVGDEPITINYCPLTGTGMAWNRKINGTETTFGVSGLLYNSNLILYDRATDSHWSQIIRAGIEGKHKGREANVIQVLETTWGIWKQIAPSTTTLSLSTGFSRSYGRYPYGNYLQTDNLLFPINAKDLRRELFHLKERLFGVPSDDRSAKVYSFNKFGNGHVIVEDLANGRRVTAGTDKFLISFSEPKDLGETEERVYTFLPNSLPAILQDQLGNTYNAFGEHLSGPNPSFQLIPENGFVGYWFSWNAFFDQVEL